MRDLCILCMLESIFELLAMYDFICSGFCILKSVVNAHGQNEMFDLQVGYNQFEEHIIEMFELHA